MVANSSSLAHPHSATPHSTSRRNLVLCLDGTNSTFSSPKPSNVVLLFKLLTSDPDTQLRYYQSGIGTYGAGGNPGGSIGKHIRDAYTFLAENYKTGDQIHLFGFSRGAHQARALAGMLQKVGLLIPGGLQTVESAYKEYIGGTAASAAAFKLANSRDVRVAFIGCWDTVASVGALTATCLPFALGTSAITTFRHALSLDERRVRFAAQVWTNPSMSSTPYDAIFPTDVRERWFAGGHRDVGAGRGSPDSNGVAPPRLSSITLRWMINEAYQNGVQIDRAALFASSAYADFLPPSDVDVGFEDTVEQVLRRSTEPSERLTEDALAPREDKLSYSIGSKPGVTAKIMGVGVRAVQRLETGAWWLLEFLPLHRVVWDPSTRKRSWTYIPHLGQGRHLPSDAVLHESVKIRLNAKPSDFMPPDGEGIVETMYTPSATFPAGRALSTATFGS